MKRKVHNPKKRQWLARRTRSARNVARADRVRLTVFRSARHIYAQIVDPDTGRTLASVSSRSQALVPSGESLAKTEQAKRVGKAIAELAREKQIEEVVFNRNGFLYHGRVKALAEAAREAGLRF